MVFTSGIFLFFFIVVYAVYILLSHRNQNIWLLLASYVFYGFWDYRFLGLMFLTSTLDFWCGLKIQEARQIKINRFSPKAILVFSLVVNFLILGVFKYYNFFIDSMTQLLQRFDIAWQPLHLNIILPLGISFYTFQSVSYVIDIYRKETTASPAYFDFLLFVSFFPQLIAGPIERSKDLLSQVSQPRTVSAEGIQRGLWLILWGVFCKVYVANNLWAYTAWGTSPRGPVHGIDIWVIGIAWAFQFYCDFAGYSRIAQGLGLLMGFRLSKNFNFPYFSQNPFEYWRRWHMTLSFWFRDYLYKPLKNYFGGSQRAAPLILCFLLIGFWHGANWTFLFWGFSWGVVLTVHRFLNHRLSHLTVFKKLDQIPILKIVLTFSLVIILNAQLVAENLSFGLEIQRRLLFDWTASARAWKDLTTVLFFIGPALVLDLLFFTKGTEFFFEEKSWPVRVLIYGLMLFLLIGGSGVQSHDFIYFQF
jgi:alginate O-acetyltransferase complex protein AlgI